MEYIVVRAVAHGIGTDTELEVGYAYWNDRYDRYEVYEYICDCIKALGAMQKVCRGTLHTEIQVWIDSTWSEVFNDETMNDDGTIPYVLFHNAIGGELELDDIAEWGCIADFFKVYDTDDEIDDDNDIDDNDIEDLEDLSPQW